MLPMLRGVGTAVPEHVMTQDDAYEITRDIAVLDRRQERLMKVMFRRSGVKTRHTVVPHQLAYQWCEPTDEPMSYMSDDRVAEAIAVEKQLHTGPTTGERMRLYGQFAGPLANDAARDCLVKAGVEPCEVTHLVTVSCTGFAAPGVDIELMEALSLPPTTQRINVGFMGCHGAINGMRAATALATADPTACVLVCAVELCSLHFRFSWCDEGMAGNALFADGSASVVVAGHSVATSGRSDWAAERPPIVVRDTASCVLPDSKGAMSWLVGDFGFEMGLSQEVGDRIRDGVGPWLDRWLTSHDLRIDAIPTWIVHPGGPRILDSVEEALGLSSDALSPSRETLSQYGNMSSPTVLFILDRLQRSGIELPAVMLGFGPGLVAEAVLLDR